MTNFIILHYGSIVELNCASSSIKKKRAAYATQ